MNDCFLSLRMYTTLFCRAPLRYFLIIINQHSHVLTNNTSLYDVFTACFVSFSPCNSSQNTSLFVVSKSEFWTLSLSLTATSTFSKEMQLGRIFSLHSSSLKTRKNQVRVVSKVLKLNYSACNYIVFE